MRYQCWSPDGGHGVQKTRGDMTEYAVVINYAGPRIPDAISPTNLLISWNLDMTLPTVAGGQ